VLGICCLILLAIYHFQILVVLETVYESVFIITLAVLQCDFRFSLFLVLGLF